MDIFYNIVSERHYTVPEKLSTGEVIDFPQKDIVADIEAETFEEAIIVLREQCKNPEVTEVALYYYVGCPVSRSKISLHF